jgi:hypothetical protein
MTISSRTPEGAPQRCPICGNESRLELSTVSADAPCPSCGCLLWLKRPRAAPHARWQSALKGLAKVAAVVVLIALLAWVAAALAKSTQPHGLGRPELAVLGIIGVVLFGRKLPEAARRLGQQVASRNR